jgi:salicylate hydroxylase
MTTTSAGAHAQLRNSVMRSKTREDWYDALACLYGSNGLEENNFGG